MTWLLLVIVAVYGLLFGSFINAWAWRLAHEESIAQGRSHCTSCGAPIHARDNVPVVSWLLLRGRCRDCGAPISWRYPVGEAVTAALFVAVAAYDGLSWILVPHLIFVGVMVLVSEVDLDIQIIPDVIILPAAAVGLPLMIVLGDAPSATTRWSNAIPKRFPMSRCRKSRCARLRPTGSTLSRATSTKSTR